MVLSAACTSTKSITKQKPANNIPSYELMNDWWNASEDTIAGQISAVAVDINQNVLVFRRTGRKWSNPFPDSLISLPTVTVLDGKTGNVVATWGANQFIMPHSITVDRNNNVWITDVALQQVFKFNHNGNLLMTLGVAGTAGNDASHFNLPTDVAIAEDGSFYVSDGYGNSRIVKFSGEGKYLFEWGVKGNGKGAFQLPHSLDLDAHGNVYVADRENNRIQKFDSKGKFIKEWNNTGGTKLYALAVNKNDNEIVAVDLSFENKVVKGADMIVLDSSLNLLTRFGSAGLYSGPVCVYHDVAVDKDGNIYTANILGNTVQKFRKIAGQ